PYIYVQPTNQIAYVGQTARFVAAAFGTPPIGYQWIFNETNAIPGATNSTLILSNVQLANAGNYSVLTTNAYASSLTSNAVLPVLAPPPCAGPPSNILSWWRAEGNAVDESGGNPGSFSGNVVFGTAEVGQGFVFDGSSDAVQIGNAVNLRLQ